MRIEKLQIDKTDPRQYQEPFLRLSLDGRGCPLLGCNCSSPSFITLSDGEVLLTVELTPEEARQIGDCRFFDSTDIGSQAN